MVNVSELEHAIMYASMSKAYLKQVSGTFQSILRQGYLKDEEEALLSSAILGFDRLDSEIKQFLAHTCQRSEKVTLIEKALQQQINQLQEKNI